MRVCKYLTQRVRKNQRIECKIIQGYFKNKKEKKHMKRWSFITQFKIEFLLKLTSHRNVLGKNPWFGVIYDGKCNYYVLINFFRHCARG